MEYGLIGEKLGHSYSVKIHKEFGDYSYELKSLKKEDLPKFFADKNFKGINVTIPYKQEVFKYLDEVSEKAAKIGAVNTVINKNGWLIGDNTDYYGVKALADFAKIDFCGANVLVLGSGGTNKTVTAVCADCGAKSVTTVSRNGKVNYDNVYDLKETDIIFNTTPVGMFPNIDGKPVDLSKFPNLKGVLDAVYNPLKTKLILQAESLGLRCAGGLMMLVAQGAKASELFTGKLSPDIVGAYKNVKRQVTDIVLVGMPGSGKSAIGRELATALNLEFVDIDAEIEKTANKSIPEIFATDGEEFFRNLETEVLKKSCLGGKVIATGGGIIKRSENREVLKQNGRVYYIKRQLNLLATGGRPLSTENGVEKLFEERKSLYESVADVQVENNEISTAVKKIKEDFLR